MSSIYTLLLVIQIISAFVIIGLVLMQHGKGADMGSSFGSGSAGSLFGATGAANFLSRTTKWAAVLFFAVTTGLAYFSYAPNRAKEQAQDSGLMQGYQDLSVPQLDDVPLNHPGGAAAVPSVGDVPAVQQQVPQVDMPAPSAIVPDVDDAPAAKPASLASETQTDVSAIEPASPLSTPDASNVVEPLQQDAEAGLAP